MDAIDVLTRLLLARRVEDGASALRIEGAVQETLSAELLRLARQRQLRIRTVAFSDALVVTRVARRPQHDDHWTAVPPAGTTLRATHANNQGRQTLGTL